jgi:predicted PurR-regulated permease PerM
MVDARLMRLLFHVGAVAGAILAWWVFTDFAAALLASAVIFFAISGLGRWLHGPLPTGDDLRQDVEKVIDRNLPPST